jgi:predicted ATPase
MLKSLKLQAAELLPRVLRDPMVRLTRITVFVGPNGSGKSTFLDAFRTLVLSRNVSWTAQTAPVIPAGECRAVLFASSELDNPRLFAKRNGDGSQVHQQDLEGSDVVVMLRSREVSHGQSNYSQMQTFFKGDDYDVIVLDEPENALDLDGILWLYQAVKTTSKQIILATHNPLLLQLSGEPDGSLQEFGKEVGYAERITEAYQSILAGGVIPEAAPRLAVGCDDGRDEQQPAVSLGARKTLTSRKPRPLARD